MVILLRTIFLLLSLLIPDAKAQEDSPHSKQEDSPHSKQNKICKKIRHDFVVESEAGTSPDFNTPEKEKILFKHLHNDKNIKVMTVAKETVFYWFDLFDLDQKFLVRKNKQVIWMTLDDMMKDGRAGISYRAGIEIDDLLKNKSKSSQKLSKEEKNAIFKIQRKYTYELHHTTQKMHGFGIMPILNWLHMGGGDAFVVLDKENSPNGTFQVVKSGLDREAVKKFKSEEGERLYKNALHTKNGKSVIKREEFDKQRPDIWQAIRLKYIKNQQNTLKPKKLFD